VFYEQRSDFADQKSDKAFPGVMANSKVNLTVRKGEIHAIMGENGAGKSTLCNMLTGVLTPTEGEIIFDGKPVLFSHPSEALKVGIRMVYQERNLIGYLTAAQSICLGLEDTKHRIFVDEDKIIERSRKICEDIGADLPLDTPVDSLSPAQQQMVEIIRAVAHSPQLLILDEPTASLGNTEVEILFGVMRKLKEKGVAIIIITHKLEEVFAISDVITILRNGELIDTVQNGSISRLDVVRMMLGKEVSGHYPAVTSCVQGNPILQMEHVADGGDKIHDVSMEVRCGEVVGIYGLLGAGRTETLETIFGLRTVAKGRVLLNGKEMRPNKRPREMIDSGAALVPEDRRNLSIFRDFFTIRENMTIGYLDKISTRAGFINKRAERALFRDLASRPELRVRYTKDNQDISQLSGGNQQKVVLGRWIYRDNLKLLLLDEPTNGIDVGVKYDIYVLIRKMASDGKGVLIVSSELPELTAICDKLYIMKDGQIVDTVVRKDFDNEKILEMVL
jgi:ribose transport system ATP-binding protein